MWVWMCLCLCIYEEKEDEEMRSLFILHGEEREKNAKCEINKIIAYITTVTLHIHSYNNRADIHDYCTNV